MNREEKAKVVAAWGTDFVVVAALAILHQDNKKINELNQDYLKKRMNSSVSSNGPFTK